MFDALIVSFCIGMQDVNTNNTDALIRGGLWLPRLGGTVEDGGGKIDFETNIDVRNKETVPMVEFSLQPIDDVVFSMSFFDFSTSGDGLFSGNDVFGGVAFNNGDGWSASTTIQSVGFEAAWSAWKPYSSNDNATLSFAPVIGLRWFGVDSSLTNTTIDNNISHTNSWIALSAGLEMEFRWDTRKTLEFADSISIEGQFLAGTLTGGDGGSMWSVQAGIAVDFSPNIGGFFGYRLQELNAQDGTYTFDAGLQGLFVGGEIRF